MICSSSVDGSRFAMPLTTSGSDFNSGRDVPKPPTDRLEHIRESLKGEGLSDKALRTGHRVMEVENKSFL